MVQLARHHTNPAATITYRRWDPVTADAPADLGQHRVDAVICANSLFHVTDKPALLRRLTPLLTPGAVILFSLYDTVFQPRQPLAGPCPPSRTTR